MDEILGDRHLTGLKIDVEGAEKLVLEGSRLMLKEQRVDVIQLEWNDQSQNVFGQSRAATAALLEENGYSLFNATPNGLEPLEEGAVRKDIFAVSPQFQDGYGFRSLRN
jgi:ABC-type Fe2+-enterobactin transport system substrate-binding protein